MNYDTIFRFISKLLNEAKVSSVAELKGIPVEVTVECMARCLHEH